jgi:hypothetical protein
MNKLTKTLLTLSLAYVLVRTVEEYVNFYQSGPWLEMHVTLYWVRFTLLLLFCLAFFIVVFLALWQPRKIDLLIRLAIKLREAIGWFRWPIALLLAMLPPIIVLYTHVGSILTETHFHLLTLIVVGFLVSVLIPTGITELTSFRHVAFSLVILASMHLLADYFSSVTAYPFSLTWSEGNRLYDYSVYLGSSRYIYPGKLTIPYYSPGRYLLWGIIYALPNTPIWLHRLWDALLWTLPAILLGVGIAHWSKLDRLGKWTFGLWAFLFLAQGPIYTPLVLSAILVVLSVQKRSWLLSLLGVGIASFYAALSRWTWLPAAAIWAMLILLSQIEIAPGERWKDILRKLAPVALVVAVGLAAGTLANPDLYLGGKMASSMAFSQALLWYRLFPNATYSDGILLGLAIAAGPLVALLVWSALSGWWQLNWLQKLAYTAACLVTLGAGLVASVKIGGGSNLHNLDMFLITLVILAGLLLSQIKALSLEKWSVWVTGLLVLTLFIPAWSAIWAGRPLVLPEQRVVDKALQTIRDDVGEAQQRGEVLFMDQRQLLTFGYVKGLPLVSDYEKKYVMDKAMANDQAYFEGFYRDLAQKRFTLIVSEPLKLVEQGIEDSFGEENNAWVRWVSGPVLCYYKPVVTLKEVRVQLLVPRESPKNCP